MSTVLFFNLCVVLCLFVLSFKLAGMLSFMRKGKKINIKTTANISTTLELQYIAVFVRASVHVYVVCSCHHKTIRSVGWVLLMQVNIAPRAAILIMGNIIQYIRDDYEPLARPTKLQAHSAQDAFSFTRSRQATLHYWHPWQNVDAFSFFRLLHSIQRGMEGGGK